MFWSVEGGYKLTDGLSLGSSASTSTPIPSRRVPQRGTAEFGERSDQGDTLFVKATAVF